MDDREFISRADEAVLDLNNRLGDASGEFPLESDLSAGALVIEFEESPAKFVVSPNSPVKQIWVSALSKSFKLDWDPTRNEFVLPATKQSLKQLISSAISEQLKEKVEL